jgi:hypothetical protein
MLKQVSSYIMYITSGICTPTCPNYSQQLDSRHTIMANPLEDSDLYVMSIVAEEWGWDLEAEGSCSFLSHVTRYLLPQEKAHHQATASVLPIYISTMPSNFLSSAYEVENTLHCTSAHYFSVGNAPQHVIPTLNITAMLLSTFLYW